MKRLFLIDAYALIFKYYYAFFSRPMRNREGLNTSVIFGFVKFLHDLRHREHPDLLGVAFDPKGGCFRRELYPEYKANRAATPEDIILSVPYVKQILEAMDIPILEVAGYEADDVIGTLSQKGVAAGYEVFMVTPDKDYGQLVRDHCKIYKQHGDGVEILDRAAIESKYGIPDPVLVRDILALWGDTSDNIPGVPGIGEKSACKLVGQWGTVENILANVSQIKGRQGERLAENREQLLLSKELTTIRLDVPIELDEEALQLGEPHYDRLLPLYTALDFRTLGNEARSHLPAQSQPSPTPASPAPQPAVSAGGSLQTDMFATADTPAPAPAVPVEAPRTPEVQETELFFDTVADATTTPHTYHLIGNEEELQALVARLSTAAELCFDTETTGFDIFRDRIVGLSFAVEPHEAWYIPFPAEAEGRERYAAVLRPLFADTRIDKIGQNLKFDIMVLRRAGIEVAGRLVDTMLLHYLLDPESRHNMNALALKYLNYRPIEIETLIGRGAKQLSMDLVPVEQVAEYAAEDADVTLRLKRELYPLVCSAGLEQLYFDIEAPMIEVLADIEMAGVKIDTEALHRYGETLGRELSELEGRLRTLADEPTLNVNSPRQLGEVLFGKMKIAEKPKMTKTRQYCTDEEYLQGFAAEHEIVALILKYRGIKKLLSTYVEALPQLVNPVTGRIHTSYNQAVTATGRLSSTNPNLQNIPVREEIGRPIRAAFIPSDGEHLLLSADYSQVELRLMAHISGDESLIEAFAHGEDIHAATAARLFSKPLDAVTSEERRRAKTANFGIIYGISAFGLSQRLDIPRKEAKAIIDGYFASYPQVHAYMQQVVEQARNDGYVTTIFGRRRFLNDINSRNAIARGLAERNAVNAPIQGSAADIMKIAMIEVHRRFRREGLRSRVILQVHDELIVDLLREEQEQVVRIVTEAMESAAQLRVRLVVDYGIGQNWLEAH